MSKEEGLSCFGLVVLFVLSIVVASLMNGWALSVLWGWFVSPIFGVPNLQIMEAIGFSLVVGMLTQNTSNKDDDSKKSFGALIVKLLAVAVFKPAFVVFLGWIILKFM